MWALAVAEVNQVPNGRHFFADGLCLIGKSVVDEQNRRLAIIQAVADFHAVPARVDRTDDAARPEGGEERFNVTVGIKGQQTDPLLSLKPQAAQRASQVRYAPGEVTVTAAARPENRGDSIRMAAQRAMQALCQIVVGHIMDCQGLSDLWVARPFERRESQCRFRYYLGRSKWH